MVDMYASVDDRIVFYKTLNCHKMFVHDWSACPYKHKGEKARRRCLLEYHYSGKICPEMKENGECSKGDQCNMTHSMFEYWMHPEKYRTTMCKDGPGCQRPFCFFAHNDQELRDPEDLPALLREPTATLPPETLSNLPPGTLTASGSGPSAAAIAAGQALPGVLAAIAASSAATPAHTRRSSSPTSAGAAATVPGLAYRQQQATMTNSAPLSDCSTATTCSGNLICTQQLMSATDAADALALGQLSYIPAPVYNSCPMAAVGSYSACMTLAGPDSSIPHELQLAAGPQTLAARRSSAASTHETLLMPLAAAAVGNSHANATSHIIQQQQHLQHLQAQLHLQQQQLQRQLQQQQQQAAAAAAATAANLAAVGNIDAGGLMQQLQQLGLDGQQVLSAAHSTLSSPQRRQMQEQLQQQLLAGAAVLPHAVSPGMTADLAGAPTHLAAPLTAGHPQGLVHSSAPFLLRSISLPAAAATTAPPSPAGAAAAGVLLPNAQMVPLPAEANVAMALGGCLNASLASYPGVKATEPRLFELF